MNNNSTRKSHKQIIIYVGDVTEELANAVLKIDNHACLIDHTNCTNLQPGTYYVSIGDLKSIDQFKSVLTQANGVVYLPPEKWTHPEMKQMTESCFIDLHGIINVQNFDSPVAKDLNLFLGLEDKRKTESAQLWSVGCSITIGVGVNPDERYGQLLSNSLNLDVSFLARTSSSLIWQADQILRSDLRSGDLLVWGLTALPRFPYVFDNNLIHANASSLTIDKIKNIVDIDVFDSQDLLYRSIVSIYQVINFCKKTNVKFVLANLISAELPAYIHTHREFINLRTLKKIDLGSDNQHPGKLHHVFYYEQLLKKINELYPEVV